MAATAHPERTADVPTYEYRCDHCDRTFDVVQSFHDDALTACPTCGNPVRKVFGNVGIVFKGSGFYKTDSRSGGSSGPKESKEPAAASSTSGDTAGSGDTATKPSTTNDKKPADGAKSPTTSAPSSTGATPAAGAAKAS